MDAKWAAMTAEIKSQTDAWEVTKATRTETMRKAIEAARKKIAEAEIVKLDALDAEEKEVRWAITSIYNYDEQDSLNKALTAAREEANAECKRMTDQLNADLEQVGKDWSDSLKSESDAIDANTAAAVKQCEDAKKDNKDALDAFIEQQNAGYDDFESGEDATVADFLAQARAAWDDILVSYCLKHGLDGDLKVGYGCSWGQGAGAGNAGYKKGVEIEANMDVLTKGQDPIDIKHIHDEEWLIQGAKDFMMQGVADEADRLLNDQLASDNAEREAALLQARKDLEEALNARLWEMVGELNDKREDLSADLLDREVEAMEGVVEWREAREKSIDELRRQIQWDIKELVWKLGYSQGYHYGAHDGHDAELMRMITEKKNDYARAIETARVLMDRRVIQETEDGRQASEAAM